jgi:hypothetical protein
MFSFLCFVTLYLTYNILNRFRFRLTIKTKLEISLCVMELQILLWRGVPSVDDNLQSFCVYYTFIAMANDSADVGFNPEVLKTDLKMIIIYFIIYYVKSFHQLYEKLFISMCMTRAGSWLENGYVLAKEYNMSKHITRKQWQAFEIAWFVLWTAVHTIGICIATLIHPWSVKSALYCYVERSEKYKTNKILTFILCLNFSKVLLLA